MNKKQQILEEELDEKLTFARWQEALRDGQLLGHQCRDCDAKTTFPRGACDHCGSRNLMPVEFPTTGEVYSESTVYVAPEGFEGGYQLALVDLDGAYTLARVQGEASIGDTVEFDGTFEGKDDPAPLFTVVD